ncbi:MAG: ATP-binding protein [Chloroflexi bacterium]|nr:ATP-binding protein [Chloroflexota bacterium]
MRSRPSNVDIAASTPISVQEAQSVLDSLDRLALYTHVLHDDIFQCYCAMLRCVAAGDPPHRFAATAAKLSGLLAQHSERKSAGGHGDAWQDFLVQHILEAENAFTQRAALAGPTGLSTALRSLAEEDLAILQRLFNLNAVAWRTLAGLLAADENPPYLAWDEFTSPGATDSERHELDIREKLMALQDWREAVPLLAAHYRRHGTGDFARYRAFRWVRSTHGGNLQGVPHPDPIRLEELIGDDRQRRLLMQNTEHLLAGYRANNVLLSGDRGTGKSSSIKALLHRYGDRGLRLIEVAKEHLNEFPDILMELQVRPQSFVVFVDDLSFEPHETDYKALKAILEGSVAAQPRNVVIYATSNRSHLIRENFSDRAGILEDEVHPKETLQETFSLSDRFGIRISFVSPTQAHYLAIVAALTEQRGLQIQEADLRARAITWAQQQNGFSGRTARQFVDFLEGDIGTGKSP